MIKKQIILFIILCLSINSIFQHIDSTLGINDIIPQTDNPIVGIFSSYSSDFRFDEENLPLVLQNWNFNVEKILSFQSLIEKDVDILVIPRIKSNLYANDTLSLNSWWNLGNKSILISGHSVSGDTDAYDLNNTNRILHAINTSIYFEFSSLFSNREYDDRCVFADQYSNHNILKNTVYNKSCFWNPTAIIGYNNSEYLSIEESQLKNVNWLIKGKNLSNRYENIENQTYIVHENDTLNSVVLMASQTWDNGNKLILSGDSIFMEHCGLFPNNKFDIPDNLYIYKYDLLHNTLVYGMITSDNSFIVFNIFNWFKGYETANETFILMSTEITYIKFNKINIMLDISSFSNTGSGIAFFNIYLNNLLLGFSFSIDESIDEQELTITYDDYIDSIIVEVYDFAGNRIYFEHTVIDKILPIDSNNSFIQTLNILLIISLVGLTTIVLLKKI